VICHLPHTNSWPSFSLIKSLVKITSEEWTFLFPGYTALMGSGFYITHRHTTFGGTPLDERSARRKDLWRYKITVGIRTRIPSKRVTSDPRHKPRDHRGRQECSCDAIKRGSLFEFHNMLRFSDEKLLVLRVQPMFGCLPADRTHWQPSCLEDGSFSAWSAVLLWQGERFQGRRALGNSVLGVRIILK